MSKLALCDWLNDKLQKLLELLFVTKNDMLSLQNEDNLMDPQNYMSKPTNTITRGLSPNDNKSPRFGLVRHHNKPAGKGSKERPYIIYNSLLKIFNLFRVYITLMQ